VQHFTICKNAFQTDTPDLCVFQLVTEATHMYNVIVPEIMTNKPRVFVEFAYPRDDVVVAAARDDMFDVCHAAGLSLTDPHTFGGNFAKGILSNVFSNSIDPTVLTKKETFEALSKFRNGTTVFFPSVAESTPDLCFVAHSKGDKHPDGSSKPALPDTQNYQSEIALYLHGVLGYVPTPSPVTRWKFSFVLATPEDVDKLRAATASPYFDIMYARSFQLLQTQAQPQGGRRHAPEFARPRPHNLVITNLPAYVTAKGVEEILVKLGRSNDITVEKYPKPLKDNDRSSFLCTFLCRRPLPCVLSFASD
jgi:hypothetical protein